jgi:DNA adenine methylase
VPYFPAGMTEMCSPFFGGGSIELFVAAQGVKVYGYDIFTPLVEFWQTVQYRVPSLVNAVRKHFPLSRDGFYQLQKDQECLSTKLERAAAFYALNRSSFSGSTLSGGMSPNHPRFNETSIQRLWDFKNPNFSVEKLDFKQSLLLRKHIFAYLDPPYLIKLALYGKDGDTHKGFDHEGLRDILSKRDNWIMSYNDCPEIREMYSGNKIVVPNWKYGMSKNKSSNEVLIFSKDLD